MESFCDSTKNFIPGKPYAQISLNSSITEEDARKQCMEHTMKSGPHEGKDFFFQQHGNGYTICGFYNDKINNDDIKQNHGHTFGGICAIPKNADVLLLVNEKLEPLKNSILENKNKLNLVKLKSETNSSGIQSLTSQVNELENIATTLQTADNNMIKSILYCNDIFCFTVSSTVNLRKTVTFYRNYVHHSVIWIQCFWHV